VIIDGRLEADPSARWSQRGKGAVCVGITVLTGAPIHDALAVSRAVKSAQPACRVVWGGWHPSLFATECLADPSVDVVVSGQGEDAFRDIVDRLIAGEPVDRSHSRPMQDLNAYPSARLFPDTGGALLRAQGRQADRPTSRRKAAVFAARSAPIPRCSPAAGPGWRRPRRDEVAFSIVAMRRTTSHSRTKRSSRARRASTRWPNSF
jgi:radical SAM superfamily enzyme YgiQ (UPF0313 family)